MVKGPLAIISSLVIGGGITGLVHATPTILQSTETVCHLITEVTDNLPEVNEQNSENISIRWPDGKFSPLPWEGGLKAGPEKSANCYKR